MPNTPIQDLGDKIKNGLSGGQSGQVGPNVGLVVDGLTSLVDGIIGN